MDTTCIIVASSFIGGLCTIIGISCCCIHKPSNNITPVTETITITKEHYETLKNYIQNENAPLPEYVETIEPPPEYIIE
jgi:hypothetical protein